MYGVAVRIRSFGWDKVIQRLGWAPGCWDQVLRLGHGEGVERVEHQDLLLV